MELLTQWRKTGNEGCPQVLGYEKALSDVDCHGTFAHKNTFTWKPSAFKACRISCTLEIRKCSASFVIQDTWTWQFVSEGGWTARAKTAEFERVCKQTLKTVTIRHVVILLKLSSYIGSSTNCIKLHHRLARRFFKSFKDFLRCLVILYIRELLSFWCFVLFRKQFYFKNNPKFQFFVVILLHQRFTATS